MTNIFECLLCALKTFPPPMGPTDSRGRTENSQGEDDIISDGAEGQSHSLGLRLYPRGPCDQAGRSLGRQYLSRDLIGEKEPPWWKPRVCPRKQAQQLQRSWGGKNLGCLGNNNEVSRVRAG